MDHGERVRTRKSRSRMARLFLGSDARHSERRSGTAVVHQLAGVLGEDIQQPRQTVEFINVCNVAHVPIKDEGNIVFQPCCPARRA